ncbi:ATP-binding protein [Streptomyces sp. NBC_01317]|uniref:ATP-binding protein n=1 Tax=Streptomyces sp. NBC_01317 TaxID=2903822 RepID=UPI002E1091B1|nr:ATP-binding protein [Streptomyces sp. NBC_01317]
MVSEAPPYRPQSVCFVDQLSLVAVNSAAATARRFLRLSLAKWQAGCLEDDAFLVTSELVTNAVAATGVLGGQPTWDGLKGLGLVTVRLIGLPDSVVIEVWDVSEEEPALRHDTAPEDESGRGLLLVHRCAKRWGVYRVTGGKVVWAELAVGPVPPPPPLPKRQRQRQWSERPLVVPGPTTDPDLLRLLLAGLQARL